MYKDILVPLDGSKLSEAVLPYAKVFAVSLHLPVKLLHVNDWDTAAPSTYATQGACYLKQVAATFPTYLTVDYSVENGRAAEVIVDQASRDGRTLITMATHGRSGAQRWLLGSVAQKVLQASINPLLLIRPNKETAATGEGQLSTVILPLDGSHLAEKIVSHVVYLAKQLKLKVALIRTYTLPTTNYFMAAGVSPPVIDEMKAKIEEEITSYLETKAEQLRAEGVEEVSFLAAEGSGPEEIIELARKTTQSLVAMSTHGRSGIGRWVLGSVTDRVVSYSGDPVLVIRPSS